jgi:Nucleoside 2-deoxyribosyltransferase like
LNFYVIILFGWAIPMARLKTTHLPHPNSVNEFKDSDLNFLNPRRDDWDSSWEQKASNPQFSKQVNWELDALEYSDIIVFYFDPKTQSPITLMELGLFASYNLGCKPMVVCCPDGFWRKGNVEIVCSRFGINVLNTFDELVKEMKHVIDNYSV